MNAIELLKQQHDEVKSLFKQFEQTDEEDEKLKLYQQIADNLAAHVTIEEQLFYPAAYAKKTKELLTEAVEEHLAIKRLIADLLELSLDDDNFDAKMEVLSEQVEHHVGEEEDDLFKAARKEIGAAELDRLGIEMEDLFDELMEGSPTDAIAEQTDKAAPLP